MILSQQEITYKPGHYFVQISNRRAFKTVINIDVHKESSYFELINLCRKQIDLPLNLDRYRINIIKTISPKPEKSSDYISFENILEKINKPFLSEMDFQFWFIKELEYKFKGAVVIPEYPYKREGRTNNQYLDIFMEVDGIKYGIELKYKTRREYVQVGGYFKGYLKEQGASDLSRYDYLWDINRLEYMVENKRIDKGITIMLSNDKRIWSSPTRSDVMDFTTRFYNVDKSLKNVSGDIVIESIKGRGSSSFLISGNYQMPMVELDLPKLDIQYYYSMNEIK